MISAPGTWHIGLTRLVPPGPAGRLISGLMLFFAMVTGFAQTGVLTPAAEADSPQFAALFFSALTAYIVPMFHLICVRTIAALDTLGADAANESDLRVLIQGARDRVFRKPRAWMISVLAIGMTAGLAHNIALGLSGEIPALGPLAEFSIQAGTMLVWLLLTLALSALLDNALRLADVGRRLPLRLFEQSNLEPIARVAVSSTLVLIGAQALFPILMLGSRASIITFLPGIIATLVPMLLLALLPLRPVHDRLREGKRALLVTIDQEIRRCGTPSPGAASRVEHMTRLLEYRREARALREWPIDLQNTARFLLYVIIPPVTWIAAALIERVIDALF